MTLFVQDMTWERSAGAAKRGEQNETPESRLLSEKAQQNVQLAEAVGT